MGLLRSLMVLVLGYVAVMTVKRIMEAAEAQKIKVKAKAEQATAKIPTLKLDPVTGYYRPEA